MLVDAKVFQREQQITENRELFGRIVPLLGFRAANICFSVSIVGARAHYFKVEGPLARFLLDGKVAEGAEHFNAERAKEKATRVP